MTLLKWQNNSKLNPRFNSLMDDWFGDGYFDKVAIGTTIPAVNIKENPTNYMVSFAAPGLKKEDFKINLENNVLTISSEQKSETEDKKEGEYTRKEYNYQSFMRSFTLPETVESEAIEAKYEQGELTIAIPKKEKAIPAAKQIAIN
jgi:HSP20 family protein